MHAWEGQSFRDVDLLTQRRDPRRFGIGCATHNPAAPASICLQWFRNIPEISQWLRRMEPQRWGLRGARLIATKAELEPVLTRVDVYGMDDALIQAHNAVTEPEYALLWWGSFTELALAKAPWPAQFLQAEGLAPIDPGDTDQMRSLAVALRARVQADQA